MTQTTLRKELALSKSDLQELCKLDVPRGLIVIATQWMVIALAIAASELSGSWAVTIVALVVIATRQHALAVLMHDASHWLIVRNKLWNDLIGDFFLSYPILAGTSRYRSHHGRHHRYLNTDLDPDLHYRTLATSKREMFITAIKDVTGINSLASVERLDSVGIIGPMFKRADAEGGIPANERRRAWIFYAVVLAVVAATGIWLELLLYWIVPLVTFLSPILRFRAIAEHCGTENEHDLNNTRTVTPSWLERELIAPCNVHYHLEHHLYPGIPFYNLPEASRRLRERALYAEKAHINDGYLVGHRRVVDEVVGASAQLSASPGDQSKTA